ncbi:unnamed protein product, partial [Prorocentrum cordatum]
QRPAARAPTSRRAPGQPGERGMQQRVCMCGAFPDLLASPLAGISAPALRRLPALDGLGGLLQGGAAVEDTAKELQDHAAKTQDTLVDAVENAEVAEIKRAVFRALTRLRAATIKEG